MEDRNLESNDEIIIDFGAYIAYMKKRLLKIILVVLLAGAAAGGYTHYFIADQYASNARIFLKPGVIDGSVDENNVYSNGYMVANYVEILRGNNIQTQVANRLNVKVGVINEALDINNVTNTQLISITATTEDPSLSKKIVDETVDVFIEEVRNSLGITNIAIADEAVKAKYPVGPNLKKNIIVASGVALVGMAALYTLFFALDNKIHNGDEAKQYLGIPNLGVVPFKD